MNRIRVALIQMSSAEDKRRNLERASAFIEAAALDRAQIVALPETFNCRGRSSVMIKQAESIPGHTTDALAAKAVEHDVMILAGSILEKQTSSKAYNTSVLIDKNGEIIAKYRKVHLFDANIPNVTAAHERSFLLPGADAVTAKVGSVTFALSICYDVRFPELYRVCSLKGAHIVFVPSAFTLATGMDHWEVLLRARAVENQVYVVAPNQCGTHADGSASFGHSMVVDPWGHVIAAAGDSEEIIFADLDMKLLRSIRKSLPALKHMQPKILSAVSKRPG